MRVASPAYLHSAVLAAEFRFLDMTFMGHKGEGCAEENQDRVLHRRIFSNEGELHLMAVADGVSRCPRGGDVAQYIVEHLANDPLLDSSRLPLAILVRKYLRELHEGFYQEFAGRDEMLESASTLSVAILENGVAHCFWVGDSPIFLAQENHHRFVTSQISTPDLCGRLLIDCFGASAPFQTKYSKVQMAPGDVLMVATDGAIRSLEDISSMLNAYGPTQDLLDFIQRQAPKSDYFDDASLVLAQRLT
ncbi:MAG: Protein serine/threonine phosphatase PrpC, regulation of stationary phase [Chthoniobacteraceae bacterium]|nr:Protein serine/threonine phosphatase PrpC, regulation of stationary phase [Chthoniobacteraceae bacterium]